MAKRDWPGGPNQSNWFGFAHGLLMFLAWGIAASIGLYASTHLRHTKWWFRVHLFCAAVTLVLTVAAMIIISYYFEWHFFPLVDSHHWLGFFAIIGAGIQSVLGLWAHLVYNPRRAEPPLFPDLLHGYIGRVVWIAALYNCFTGVPMVRLFLLCFVCAESVEAVI
jgi:zinc transporter ZupT